jgi:hypothetical protein
MSFLLYAVIDFAATNDFKGALFFSIPLLLALSGLVYYIGKFFIPAIKNNPAIELDDEAIQYNIKSWALNWSEIESIDSTLYGIKFIQKNGSKVYISLQYVSGNYDKIRDTINAYFENNK